MLYSQSAPPRVFLRPLQCTRSNTVELICPLHLHPVQKDRWFRRNDPRRRVVKTAMLNTKVKLLLQAKRKDRRETEGLTEAVLAEWTVHSKAMRAFPAGHMRMGSARTSWAKSTLVDSLMVCCTGIRRQLRYLAAAVTCALLTSHDTRSDGRVV